MTKSRVALQSSRRGTDSPRPERYGVVGSIGCIVAHRLDGILKCEQIENRCALADGCPRRGEALDDAEQKATGFHSELVSWRQSETSKRPRGRPRTSPRGAELSQETIRAAAANGRASSDA